MDDMNKYILEDLNSITSILEEILHRVDSANNDVNFLFKHNALLEAEIKGIKDKLSGNLEELS